jgi:leucyl-tRNA synthetase
MPVSEPYNERFNRGLIMGPDGQKMSKSKGNVINPDEMVGKYGADAVRVYLAFIGPYNEPGSYPWQLDGVSAMRKFLDRVSRLVEKASDAHETPNTLLRHFVETASKIASDGDRFKFNTGVAALMQLLNELEESSTISRSAARNFLVMLAPFAPHLSEYLWEEMGETGSVHQASWPVFDPALTTQGVVEVVVQVNGKRRGLVSLSPEAAEAEAVAAAQTIPTVSAALSGKDPKRVVYVPGKIINFVA